MALPGFEITIGTDIDRDVIAASVDYGDAQVAELIETDDGVVVTFFPGPGGEWPELPFEPLMAALRDAERRLLSL